MYAYVSVVAEGFGVSRRFCKQLAGLIAGAVKPHGTEQHVQALSVRCGRVQADRLMVVRFSCSCGVGRE